MENLTKNVFLWLLTLWILLPTAFPDLAIHSQSANETHTDVVVGSLRRKVSSGTRPYSLSLSPMDYHYFPKPKHVKVPRLLRLLGPSFDPFWMSVEKPTVNTTTGQLSTLSKDIYDGSIRYRKKLTQEAQSLDFGSLKLPKELSANNSQAVVTELRKWLVQKSSCQLTSTWVDLGPVFWPRWVRHTDCEMGKHACSWPSGMACRQTQLMQIKILAWHCWISDPGTGRTSQQCIWRQVPYPVVTACKCTCK